MFFLKKFIEYKIQKGFLRVKTFQESYGDVQHDKRKPRRHIFNQVNVLSEPFATTYETFQYEVTHKITPKSQKV